MQEPATSSGSSDHLARFSFAPPRHFALPAVLLLLSEEPNYGYELVKGLRAFRFGDVDRPAVYRALAQLEKDGLVESWSAESKAGQARRVYDLTDDGRRALRTWMGVVKEERDGLDRVLRRYRATGSADALLAEAEAGWGLVAGGTPASAPLPNGLEARMAARSISRVAPLPVVREDPAPGPAIDRTSRFIVLPERSAVLVEARSTVGQITFGALGITGFVECRTTGLGISPGEHTRARLEVPVEQLRSGNSLYDAELLRRIDARRFPAAALELVGCTPVGDAGRYRLDGRIDLHGTTRPVRGSVTAALASPGVISVHGAQDFDIRDFDIVMPTVLMFRIYPDVTVRLQIEAQLDETEETSP